MEFFLGAIRDPNTRNLSLTRASGLSLVVSGITFAFMHPDQAASIAAMLGGGAMSFFSRTKTEAAP
jgi:membrane protease YdiL (CAAX protease family)